MLDRDNGDKNIEDMAEKGAFLGAELKVEDLRREDGIIATSLGKQGLGVVQKVITAIDKDEDYRQELKTGFFLSAEEADDVVAALAEARRYGCSIKPIIDWVIARSAGVRGGRVHEALEALTHTTFTTNYAGQKKWWQRDNRPKTNQPIT